MATLSDTQVIQVSGGLAELGYSQITVPGTVTAGTAGSGNEIISATNALCDGGPIIVEFYSPSVTSPDSGTVNISLYQDGVENIRLWGQKKSESYAQSLDPVHLQARLTPTVGLHNFSVKSYVSGGTAVIGAGTGGSATAAPAYLRISKVVQASQWPAFTNQLLADIVIESGTARTLTLSDSGTNRWVNFTSNSNVAVTIPPNSSVAFPIGTTIRFLCTGAGQVTIGGGTGVTLYGQIAFGYGQFDGGSFGDYVLNQSDGMTLIKVGTDTWTVFTHQNTPSLTKLG